MPQFRIGRPLKGNFADLSWSSMAVFDVQQLVSSVIFGSVLAACCAAAWLCLDASSLPIGAPSGAEIILVSAFLIVAHEASHVLGFPSAGFNSNTIIGIWLAIASPYVQYLMPMGRNRFMLVLLLPFLTLSVFPLCLALIGIELNKYISWISVLNCLGAGSDIFIFGKMLISVVPACASVLESDGKLYWSVP